LQSKRGRPLVEEVVEFLEREPLLGGRDRA
jgi:hypothetical protein